MSQENIPSFVGTGISFPLRIDANGGLALTSGAEDIEKSMRVILSTAVGERPMRPHFGCAIWDLLFEPMTANTLGMMEDAVRQALSRWEPRAQVDNVRIAPAQAGLGAVSIAIAYTIRSTNESRNLVHPFYLIPGEGDGTDSPGGAT